MWFGRFQYYLEIGPERNIEIAYRAWLAAQAHKQASLNKKGLRCPQNWRDAMKAFQWEQRATSYDTHIAEEKLRIQRQLEKEDLEKWEERARLLRDRKWELSDELNALCRKGLRFPLTTQTIEEDGRTVVVAPQKWTFRDMIAAAETSVDLGDRALGKPDVDIITAIEVVIAEGVFPDDVNAKLLAALESGFDQWRDRIRNAIQGDTEVKLPSDVLPE